ncbi:hypothetical protein DUNSADRAFT_12012, partial [Dunaliella salina]
CGGTASSTPLTIASSQLCLQQPFNEEPGAPDPGPALQGPGYPRPPLPPLQVPSPSSLTHSSSPGSSGDTGSSILIVAPEEQRQHQQRQQRQLTPSSSSERSRSPPGKPAPAAAAWALMGGVEGTATAAAGPQTGAAKPLGEAPVPARCAMATATAAAAAVASTDAASYARAAAEDSANRLPTAAEAINAQLSLSRHNTDCSSLLGAEAESGSSVRSSWAGGIHKSESVRDRTTGHESGGSRTNRRIRWGTPAVLDRPFSSSSRYHRASAPGETPGAREGKIHNLLFQRRIAKQILYFLTF